MNELSGFVGRLEQVVGPAAVDRIRHKAGAAGKKAALKAASSDLGGDRAMSNFKSGKVKLGAGYDLVGAHEVKINFRPVGLWSLASAGRRSSGTIKPKRRGGKKAVLTPRGPRARSTFGRSSGLSTYEDAVKDAKRDVPRAAAAQFRVEIRKVVT
jgi:hypothetical protein